MTLGILLSLLCLSFFTHNMGVMTPPKITHSTWHTAHRQCWLSLCIISGEEATAVFPNDTVAEPGSLVTHAIGRHAESASGVVQTAPFVSQPHSHHNISSMRARFFCLFCSLRCPTTYLPCNQGSINICLVNEYLQSGVLYIQVP